MALRDRALELYRNQGWLAVLFRAFSLPYQVLVHSRLPRRRTSYNGVTVLGSRAGDRYHPLRNIDKPEYESGLINGIRTYAKPGDDVVVVGGGWGVSTVVAARQVGTQGRVVTFEASPSSVRKVKETVQLNSVDNRVIVTEAVVAEAKSTRGQKTAERTLAPVELPDCDVLVLDCEGVEQEILDKYPGSPGVVIVETHGHLGTGRSTVVTTLEDRGYRVLEEQLADMSAREFCERNDIYVLYAIKSYSFPALSPFEARILLSNFMMGDLFILSL